MRPATATVRFSVTVLPHTWCHSCGTCSLVEATYHCRTSQIDAAWTQSGRKGKVRNALGGQVKNKQLKRAPVKDGRPSSYSIA
jgi:hypothetical protein